MKACWLLLLFCAPALAQEMVVARSLAATCATCHGTGGRAQGDVMRPLAGMKAELMLQALADFRSGAQRGTVMPQIARGYTQAQLNLMASYFAVQAKP